MSPEPKDQILVLTVISVPNLLDSGTQGARFCRVLSPPFIFEGNIFFVTHESRFKKTAPAPAQPGCGFRVSVSGLQLLGSGLQVSGFGFRDLDFLGFRVSSFDVRFVFRVSCFVFRVPCFVFRVSCFGLQISEFQVSGL